ncbi:hypothetical protein BDL97_12G073500 [Sphagnum fallax]|nr:hypothetical protein BDL97_12G073500 [Sphagnum fallax]
MSNMGINMSIKEKIIAFVAAAALLGLPCLIFSFYDKPSVLHLRSTMSNINFNYLMSRRIDTDQKSGAAGCAEPVESDRTPEAGSPQQQQLQTPQQYESVQEAQHPVDDRLKLRPETAASGLGVGEEVPRGKHEELDDLGRLHDPVDSPGGHGPADQTRNASEKILGQEAEPRLQEEVEDSKVLEEMLAKASMQQPAGGINNKTVIITSLNQAWAANNSMIDLFLESFRNGEGTQHLLNHLIIVALDQKAYKRCMELHQFCYKLKTQGVDFSAEQAFMTTDYVKMVWKRFEYLGRVLSLGYSFIFSDADILWFRDPFPVFDAHKDFQISCDKYVGKPESHKNSANAGFYFARSNSRTIAFYKYWYATRTRNPAPVNEQVAFHAIIKEEDFQHVGLKYSFLESRYFSSFCQRSNDMGKVVTMHANCCLGLQRKLDDLRLSLDDWASYKALSPQQKASDHIALWRAPKQCRKSKWTTRLKNATRHQ